MGEEFDRYSSVKPTDSSLKQTFIRFIEKRARIDKARELYESYRKVHQNYANPAHFIVERLAFSLHYDEAPLAKINDKKPLLVLSNHPFGLLDSVALLHIMGQRKEELKFNANYQLSAFALLAPFIIPVKAWDRDRESMVLNASAKRQAIAWLKENKTILMTPGGSMLRHQKALHQKAPRLKPDKTQLQECWGLLAANLIHATQCDVVLAFFPQSPSWLMSLCEKISPHLADALLIREVFANQGKKLKLHFSEPITYESLAPIKNRIELTIHLRQKIKELG